MQAALGAAEGALARLADARATVADVLADAPGEGAGSARGAVAARWCRTGPGVGVEVLAPEYQRILAVLALPEASDGLRVKPIVVRLGWETTPARVEGVRSRVRRLAARGWAPEVRQNVFAAVRETVPVTEM